MNVTHPRKVLQLFLASVALLAVPLTDVGGTDSGWKNSTAAIQYSRKAAGGAEPVTLTFSSSSSSPSSRK